MTVMVDYPPELGPRVDPPDLDQRPGVLHDRSAWSRFLVFVAAFLLMFCCITTTVTVLLVRDGQDSGQETLDKINDCSTPDGQCYDRSQQRLAAAIAEIGGNTRAAAAAAAACATTLQQQGKLSHGYSAAFQAILKCQTATLSSGGRSRQ